MQLAIGNSQRSEDPAIVKESTMQREGNRQQKVSEDETLFLDRHKSLCPMHFALCSMLYALSLQII